MKRPSFFPSRTVTVYLARLFLVRSFAVLAALQAAGYGPSAVTYTTLLALYGRTGQLARAEAMFAVMRETGCRPGLPAYTALLAAYGRAGWPDKAEGCFHQIKVRPTGGQARG